MAKKKNKHNLTIKHISALNEKQKKVLSSDKNLFLAGSSGTGKTYLASYIGFDGVMQGLYDRVIYFRSAVSTRDIGFLPGNEREKISVYTKPYVDICADLFDNGTAFYSLENTGTVQFEPTSFIRGKTLRDSFVIVDECQNMTFHELDSIITRLDDGCRIVFCGDTEQADLPKNGFVEFFNILETMKDDFDTVTFNIEDIVRGRLVKEYLTKKSDYFKG